MVVVSWSGWKSLAACKLFALLLFSSCPSFHSFLSFLPLEDRSLQTKLLCLFFWGETQQTSSPSFSLFLLPSCCSEHSCDQEKPTRARKHEQQHCFARNNTNRQSSSLRARTLENSKLSETQTNKKRRQRKTRRGAGAQSNTSLIDVHQPEPGRRRKAQTLQKTLAAPPQHLNLDRERTNEKKRDKAGSRQTNKKSHRRQSSPCFGKPDKLMISEPMISEPMILSSSRASHCSISAREGGKQTAVATHKSTRRTKPHKTHTMTRKKRKAC